MLKEPNKKCEWCGEMFYLSLRAAPIYKRYGTPYLCSLCRKKRQSIMVKRCQVRKKEEEVLIRKWKPKFALLYKQRTGRELKIVK